MRRIFILIVLFAAVLPSSAKSQGKQLSDLLLSYMQLEDLHPDSLERNIDSLKLCRLQSQDAAERAVYAAAIGHLYADRMNWRSVGTDLRDSSVVWYARALADKQVLAQSKAKRWKPFVVIGKDEGYFRGDMLNVVWRSMVEQIRKSVRDTSQVLPKYGEMIDFYKRQGLREGALLLALDSLDDNDERKVTETDLLRLRDEYADVPLCAEVYLRLASMTEELPRWRETNQSEITSSNQAAKRSREWLQEGLRKYPKYKRRAALQNALTELSDPFFEKNMPTCVSPGKQYWWRFKVRNVQSVLIDGKEHVFPEHDPIETFCDSILWTSPKPGPYMFTFVPRTKAKLTEKIKPMKHWIRVTTMQDLFQVMPDSSVRVLVVDPETGKPQPNVTVTAYKPTGDFNDTTAYFIGRTGQDGKVLVPPYKDKKNNDRWRSQLTYKICSPDTADWSLATRYFYNIGHWTGKPTTSDLRIELFTDRAIYRPGQTVHVSGLAYTQLDWDAEVAGEGKRTLRFYDSSHKLVEERIVESDRMGVFSADFEIPTGRKNGSFSIEADKKYRVYFRVEEYKRPTFEVVLDDSLYIDGDDCEVRGTAKNYDGSPLRGARVTGTYRWQSPWVYRKIYPQNETLQLDTIETDDKGRFEYKFKIKSEGLGIGVRRQSLSVNVDVLSQQGETHNAQHWYWRAIEPKPVPEPVKVDSTFLVRCVVDSFDVNTPGRIEVTTKLHDIYLFYTLSAAGKIWKDEMVRLSDETFVLDIPYREEYDQSLTASFCFVKEGNVYKDVKTIWLIQPDNRLRAHWDTFRDLVQPGQQEEWRLTLRRPDGTPADANLMVAMYDASLDYFAPHDWHFDIGRGHRTFGVPFQAAQRISLGLLNSGGWYNQKTKKVRSIDFTHINPELFQVGAYTRAGGRGPILFKSREVAGAMMATNAKVQTEEALQGSIAGLNDAVTFDQAESGGTLHEAVLAGSVEAEEEETITMPMRENFNETAFFYPQLRTDAKGQVSISFTLPESLTRWNLMGLAHTEDMMYTNLSEQIEARKDLMAQLYLPRFLRPGDEAVLTASVRNVSDQLQQGKGVMQILDAKTEKVIKSWKTNIRLESKQDTVLHFPYEATEGDLIVRWAVEGTTCSDGEQRLLPVLSPTEHVTNTIQITAYDPSVQNIDLSSLFPDGVTNRQLTLEYTTHPEQYALQALPVLARAKRNDVLSLASAYYAGVLGKALGVEMPDSTEAYLEKIKGLQDANGGFRWYPEMQTSPYLTREVSFLLTRLYMLTGKKVAEQMNTKAIHYLLEQKIDSTYLSAADLRNLYVALYSGVRLSKEEQKKVDFLMKLAKREDVEEDGYERQALLAIVLKQGGADRKARKCVNEFRKYIVSHPDKGSYIEFPKGSFVSIDRKLHIHVQLMEALQRMNPADTLLRGMRRYLLQQKRTQEWSTPINSANAVFALLAKGEALKANDGSRTANGNLKDLLTLTRKGTTVQNFIARDDTLGYLRDSMEIEDGKLPVRLRLQKFSKGESWGGVFADFEQRFDQVEAHSEGLSVRQEYPAESKTGSRYTVRYYISADRDYEYVTLVVPRPAFTEPVNQRSGYGWSGRSTIGWAGGLSYYRQVHDATTEFSFCQIPRGEYLIEETLYVERDGRYHSGIAVIRCEYAEEFQGHSDDKVIEVKK